MTKVVVPKAFPQLLDGALVERLKVPGVKIADVGCSGGENTCILAKEFPSADIVAGEVADVALERLPSVVAEHKNVKVVDLRKDSLASQGPFDFVFCYDVVHDCADPRQLMRDVRAALKPDGVWMFVDIRCSSHGKNIAKDPKAALCYGISMAVCLQSGMSSDKPTGLGCMGLTEELANEWLKEAGFSFVRVLDTPGLRTERVFEARP
eukprot:Hpha_TRINITY_DN15262_c1_g2::TRINITY_DN15262_c1_g2_i4::g.64338::m.64338